MKLRNTSRFLFWPLIAAMTPLASVEALRTSRAALQSAPTASPVYFKSPTNKKYRKIVVKFTIPGIGKTVKPSEADCLGEKFSSTASSQSEVNGNTLVSAVYAVKTTPPGDSPVSSGGLADISFSVIIDGTPTPVIGKAPVIDIEPCP